MAYYSHAAADVGTVDILGVSEVHDRTLLRAELDRLVRQHAQAIALNFHGVHFMDSTGIADLAFALQDMPSHVRVYVKRVSPAVERLFRALGMTRYLPPEGWTIHPQTLPAARKGARRLPPAHEPRLLACRNL